MNFHRANFTLDAIEWNELPRRKHQRRFYTIEKRSSIGPSVCVREFAMRTPRIPKKYDFVSRTLLESLNRH